MNTIHLKKYLNPDKIRMESLQGNWKGTMEQVGDSAFREVDLQISSAGKKVKAEISYQTERGLVRLKTEGGFNSDSLIYLEYKNTDGAIIQHGLVILTLSAVPSTMSGKFLGFGPVSGELVSGSVNLRKMCL